MRLNLTGTIKDTFKGVGETLLNLRFADDAVLLTERNGTTTYQTRRN